MNKNVINEQPKIYIYNATSSYYCVCISTTPVIEYEQQTPCIVTNISTGTSIPILTEKFAIFE